ncbi:MAG: hypothetical protein HY659_02115 [Rhizobiales bacterium]|nr:hypothetical protein [Hyphomicrobiales bacterium]
MNPSDKPPISIIDALVERVRARSEELGFFAALLGGDKKSADTQPGEIATRVKDKKLTQNRRKRPSEA